MTVPVSAQRMDCTDCICMNRAFNMTVCLYIEDSRWTAQAQPIYYQHCLMWAGPPTPVSIIPLLMLLPEGKRVWQPQHKYLPRLPWAHLCFICQQWCPHILMLCLPMCELYVWIKITHSTYMCKYHTVSWCKNECISTVALNMAQHTAT